MATTLGEVTEELKIHKNTFDEGNITAEEQLEVEVEMNETLADMRDAMFMGFGSMEAQLEALTEILQGDSLKSAEDELEALARQEEMQDTLEDIRDAITGKSSIEQLSDLFGGLGAILAGGAAAGIGLILGQFKAMDWGVKILKWFSSPFEWLAKRVSVYAARAFKAIVNTDKIRESLTGAWQSFRISWILFSDKLINIGNMLKESAIGQKLGSAWNMLKQQTNRAWAWILKPIKYVKEVAGLLVNVFLGSVEMSNKWDDVLKWVGKILGPLGSIVKLVSKVFAPIALALSLFEAWDEANKEFEKNNSLLDAFIAGIAGFAADLIGAPLDLIKNGISSIVDWFGFEDASDYIDDFSFEKMFKQLGQMVIKAIDNTIDFVKTLWAWDTENNPLLKSVTGLIDDLSKWWDDLFDFEMPELDFERAMKNALASIIPDFIQGYLPDDIANWLELPTSAEAAAAVENLDENLLIAEGFKNGLPAAARIEAFQKQQREEEAVKNAELARLAAVAARQGSQQTNVTTIDQSSNVNLLQNNVRPAYMGGGFNKSAQTDIGSGYLQSILSQ